VPVEQSAAPAPPDESQAILHWPRYVAAAIFALLLLLPVIVISEPPLLDYPNHIASAYVIRHLYDPGTLFAQYFQARWGPYPYITMDLTLVGLQKFVSVDLAGRIFCALAVLAVPAGLWWLLRRADRQSTALLFFAGAVAYDELVLEGFLQFEFAIGVALFTLGTWLWYLERPSRWRWLVVFVCVVATFFNHLIVFALLAVAMGSYAVFARLGWRRLWLTAAMFVPGVALALYLRTGVAHDHTVTFRDWHNKAQALIRTPVHGYVDWIETVVWIAVIACALIAWFRNPDFRLRWPWVGAIVVLVGVFLALPDQLGQTWEIDLRVLPFAFILLPLTIQAGRRRWILAAILAAVAVLRIGTTVAGMRQKYLELSPARNSFTSIVPNSKVLPLVYYPDDLVPATHPYRHYWAWMITRRNAFAPFLFDIPGQTVLRCPACREMPDGFFDDLDQVRQEPPDWNWVKDDFDYIWLWELPSYEPAVRQFADCVFRDGPVSVYRIRRASKSQ
jgi:hypothetical protein